MTDLFDVSREEKIACLSREIALRERKYPEWVARRRMSRQKADHELRVMRAILADYREAGSDE